MPHTVTWGENRAPQCVAIVQLILNDCTRNFLFTVSWLHTNSFSTEEVCQHKHKGGHTRAHTHTHTHSALSHLHHVLLLREISVKLKVLFR